MILHRKQELGYSVGDSLLLLLPLGIELGICFFFWCVGIHLGCNQATCFHSATENTDLISIVEWFGLIV